MGLGHLLGREHDSTPQSGRKLLACQNGTSPDCIVVAWLIFVGEMCVFVSRPIEIVTFPLENGDLPKWVICFFLKKTHIPKKKVEIVVAFIEQQVTTTTEYRGVRQGFCV